MSLQRQFSRHGKYLNSQDNVDYEERTKDNKSPLARYNDSLPEQGFLHPTKGYRRVSEKRSKAQMIVAQQKQGKFPPLILVWKRVKNMLTRKEAA